MRGLLAEMERELDDREAYIRADLELHATILRATHNVLLAQLSHTISEGLVASRDVTVRSDGSMVGALALHAEVIDAIESGQCRRGAEQVMTNLRGSGPWRTSR